MANLSPMQAHATLGQAGSSGHGAHAHGHANDWKIYLAVLGALLALTVVTVGAASFDFGAANVIIAVLIATTKAALVALFFMHLRHDKAINGIIFVSALLFLAILLITCLLDINSRIEPKPHNWKGPEPGLVSPADLNKPAGGGGTAAPSPSTPSSGPAH